MPILFGPKAVTNGLVYVYDAGNHMSYPGSGTSVTELVKKNVGTMSNVTVSNGHFNFDGSTSYIDTQELDASQTNIWEGGGTWSCWMRAESDGEFSFAHIYNATNGLIDGTVVWVSSESAGNIRVLIWIYFTGNNGNWQTTSVEVPLNEWLNFVITYDSDNSGTAPTFYMNGVSISVTTTLTPSGVLSDDTGNSVIIGNNSNSSGDAQTDRTFDGDIDYVSLHNRALSAEEVLQNYNALKGRFGL